MSSRDGRCNPTDYPDRLSGEEDPVAGGACDGYRVAGDRRLAYDVLNPRFMEWMLQSQHDGFTISGDHVVYAVSGYIKLEHLDREIAYLDEIIERLPRYVING